MNVKCLTSREAFLNWVGMKYSASEKVSLDTRTFTIIGVKMPKDYKDDTEFKALRYTTQKQWEAQLKQYNNIKGKDLTNLSSCFSVLWEQLSCRTTRYVHKCTGLTRHIRHSQECSAYYSSLGLTWNRDINLSSSRLSGPTTHQQLHQPSAFGLSMTGNAPVVARHSHLPSSNTNSTISPSVPISTNHHVTAPPPQTPQSQLIQRVVPNMLQAPVDRPIIHEYFRSQSSILLESQSNNNNLQSNEGDDNTVHNDNNNDNDRKRLSHAGWHHGR